MTLFDMAEAKYGPDYLLPGNYLKNPFDQISLGLGYTRAVWPPPCDDTILHCA